MVCSSSVAPDISNYDSEPFLAIPDMLFILGFNSGSVSLFAMFITTFMLELGFFSWILRFLGIGVLLSPREMPRSSPTPPRSLMARSI